MPTISKRVQDIPKPLQPVLNDDENKSLSRDYYRVLQQLVETVNILRSEIP